MRIEELKLIPPSKQSSAILMEFMKEHEKGLKAIKTLAEIIKFFKEDEKFARYSGYPVVLTKTALEKIEKILKENDIKINEVDNE